MEKRVLGDFNTGDKLKMAGNVMNGKKIIAIISVLLIFTVCAVFGVGGDSVMWMCIA